MTNQVKINYDIEFVKRYTFQDFAESLFIQDIKATNWMKGYYFELGNAFPLIRMDENKIFLLYSGLAYAKSKYSPYIVIPRQDKFHARHAKTVDITDTKIYWVKVERVEAYDLRPIREMILEAILETERRRRKLRRKEESK